MKHLLIGAAMGALLLAGCAHQDPAALADLQRRASQPVQCSAGAECEVKWGRVLTWVQQNSAYKLRMVTDSMVATMGPIPNDPSLVFEVTKTAATPGVYAINFSAGCDNMFGCVPTQLQAQASFATFVNAPVVGLAH